MRAQPHPIFNQTEDGPMSRETILNYLFPDEQDRYLAALDREDTEGVLEVFQAEDIEDPAILFPETQFREQERCFTDGASVYGGGFVSALGNAYVKGDPENREKIRKTWPEYWVKYVFFGKDLRESDPEDNDMD